MLKVGSRLGSYEILGPLGAGGMGEVYRAHDAVLGREVAIKLLSENLVDDQRLARLRREARALAAVNHSGIATVHSLEEHDGTQFIVMELVEGPTLGNKLQQGALAQRQALEVGSQVAQALEAAHQRGIVHRDLKPDNVKVSADGRVKLLDFGIAKLLPIVSREADSSPPTLTLDATRPGTVMGTPAYMSPEQVLGEAVDEQTDVWAFGCLLYEMLSGRRAFAARSTPETLAAVLSSEPNWGALPADLPAAVRDLIERSLRKERGRRLQHIGDARIVLEEALEDLTPARTMARGQDSLVRPRRTSVVAIGLLAAAVLSLLVAGVYFLRETGAPAVTDHSIAVLPFVTLGQDEASVFTEGMHGDILARLSSLSDLRVISRHSVMQFQGSQASLPEIARELGVAWMLGGEVQQVGDLVQMNARLMDARADRQVWAETYRRRLSAENVFQIQAELTREIATALEARLSAREERALAHMPTADLEAYRLYAQGRGLLDQRTEQAMRRATDYFERASAQDPRFALAWVGLSDALLLLEDYGYADPGSLAPRAREAIDRALQIAPDLAEAHASLGLFHLLEREGSAAVRELERAIESRPSYADAHNWLCWLHQLLGDPQAALESGLRAVALDPLSPEAGSNLSLAYLSIGSLSSALETARRTREMQPDFTTAHFYEAVALYHLGRFAEAETLLRGLSLPWAEEGPAAVLGLIHLANGEVDRAREVVVDLEQVDAWADAALLYAALQSKDETIVALGRVEEWNYWPTLTIRYYFPTVLAPLREDPRYPALLREVDEYWGVGPASRERSQTGHAPRGAPARSSSDEG